MSEPLPRLAALPLVVPETTDWPELEAAIGHGLVSLAAWQRQWLTIAALHRSGLYENLASFPDISLTCLGLLESTGRAMIEVELRRAIARASPNLPVVERDLEANRTTRDVRHLVAQTLNMADRASLGAGESTTLRELVASGGSARTLEAVAMQVAGWWSLLLSGSRIREFVDGLYLTASTYARNPRWLPAL